ncbi:hypothetical protein HPB47_011951 [Ixodes persulcatus]|uniref:Uncharacterized protein n=1 Tax=Ixodes persulcatus TaxID=34615 RepID=A0AC60NV01_IXOPE|nr:hypothetical protein HPB47_011951 [Ixodes persulcatus]
MHLWAGFLPAMDGASRANNGLLDQIAALHWIQENIDVFGGDPRNVTIAGHGHGAACVNFLMMSPMAKGSGLYRKLNAALRNFPGAPGTGRDTVSAC